MTTLNDDISASFVRTLPPVPRVESIITSTQDLAEDEVEGVLAERQSTHGDFSDNSSFCEDLNEMMPKYPGWELMNKVQRNALRMIIVKISRLLSGNPHVEDPWVDIQGFAKLALRETRLRNVINQVAQDDPPNLGGKLGASMVGHCEHGERG